MKSMTGFMRTLLQFPGPWRVWVLLLMGLNLMVPLLFLPRLEAWVVLGCSLMGGGIMIGIYRTRGFVRLLGLGHLPWLPMLVWLAGRLDTLPLDIWFGEWILAVLVMNSLSLMIDTADVIRYLKGERAPYRPSPGPALDPPLA